MSLTIHKDYPSGLTDEQLKTSLTEFAHVMYQSGADINAVMRFAPYLQIGLAELQGRRARRSSWMTLTVSLVSLLVALSALGVAYHGNKANTTFDQEEIQLLLEIRESLETPEISTKEPASNVPVEREESQPEEQHNDS